MRIARSAAIAKTYKNFSWGTAFAAFIYPALGVAVVITMIVLALLFKDIELHGYYLPLAIGVTILSILICNGGIGPLHRIMQHRAGRLNTPAQVITMINLMIAMQGSVREWVNYHSQHHRFADQPGDPHNPFESKTWANCHSFCYSCAYLCRRLGHGRLFSFDGHFTWLICYWPGSAISRNELRN